MLMPENRLDGLERIGVDETSYKRAHKYLTMVSNLDNGSTMRGCIRVRTVVCAFENRFRSLAGIAQMIVTVVRDPGLGRYPRQAESMLQNDYQETAVPYREKLTTVQTRLQAKYAIAPVSAIYSLFCKVIL